MDARAAFTLAELVPQGTLEDLRRLFADTVGVPMVFTDASGRPVTGVGDPLDFCGTLVQGTEAATLCLRRKQWNVPEPAVEEPIRRSHCGTAPVAHRCRGGFRDIAVPIVVEGQTIGFAVFARSLTAPPDVAAFREMAVRGGMAPEVGEAVAARALVLPAERIAHVAEFLQVITGLVARAAYETIRARQVLELEQLRDDLTSMIVHDLRTPLTSIMGGLQTIVDADYDPELTAEFVPLALSSADTLLEMVNTLLDIHKLERGEMKLDLGPVDLSAVAATALDQVRGLARERGQELTSDLDPHCPVIQADQDKLRRVVVNLLGNAVKFTQDGGHIGLSVRCEAGAVTLAVSDDGPGIPPEYQERIFEKFGQVESRVQGHRHSTGLGLTFCKMVAEAHQGSIRVDSAPGQGSTFTVAFPLTTA